MNTAPAYSPRYAISYGSKYIKDLRVVEVAKLIRADIKAAVASGELPKGVKLAVRSDSSSIGISIKALPFALLSPEEVAGHMDDVYALRTWSRYSVEAQRVIDVLETIHNSYNFDGSDSQVDYSHVNYYGHVTVDAAYSNAERATAEADLAASRESA